MKEAEKQRQELTETWVRPLRGFYGFEKQVLRKCANSFMDLGMGNLSLVQNGMFFYECSERFIVYCVIAKSFKQCCSMRIVQLE